MSGHIKSKKWLCCIFQAIHRLNLAYAPVTRPIWCPIGKIIREKRQFRSSSCMYIHSLPWTSPRKDPSGPEAIILPINLSDESNNQQSNYLMPTLSSYKRKLA